MIKTLVAETKPNGKNIEPIYRDFRPGDVRHSLADIGKSRSLIGYDPKFSTQQGLKAAASWYIAAFSDKK